MKDGKALFLWGKVIFQFKKIDNALIRCLSFLLRLKPLSKYGENLMDKAISIYGDWALHDEIGDKVKLNEEMTHSALDRLECWQKEHALKFDFYLIDAFWYDPEGNYQQFKKSHWPQGFISVKTRMNALGMTPGLWFDVNGFAAPRYKKWGKSLSRDKHSYCLFDGPYAEGFEKALINAYTSWGIRLFKLDFANFRAVTPRLASSFSEEEIYRKNVQALKQIFRNLRSRFSDIIILAYNGFELVPNYISNTSYPLRRGIDSSWLEVFDYIYSGDPRPADVPCIDFRHSVDIYQDYMVRNFNFSGIPLSRIDDHGCMIGNTNTIYYLGKHSWRRSWILSLSRGSRKAHLYGNLHLLDNSDIKFLSKTMEIFFSLFNSGLETQMVGGIPGHSPWHGFLVGGGTKGLLTLVNATGFPQYVTLEIPGLKDVEVLFSDAGNIIEPQVCNAKLSLMLAPEQMGLFGLGEMAKSEYHLEIDKDKVVPYDSKSLPISFKMNATNVLEGEWIPKNISNKTFLRISLQTYKDGLALRLKAEKSNSSGKIPAIQDFLSLSLSQDGKELPIAKWEPNRAVWSGCSWMTALYDLSELAPKKIKIHCSYSGPEKIELIAAVSLLKFR